MDTATGMVTDMDMGTAMATVTATGIEVMAMDTITGMDAATGTASRRTRRLVRAAARTAS